MSDYDETESEIRNLLLKHLDDPLREQTIQILKFRAQESAAKFEKNQKMSPNDRLLLLAWKEILCNVYATRCALKLFSITRHGREADISFDSFVEMEAFAHETLDKMKMILVDSFSESVQERQH